MGKRPSFIDIATSGLSLLLDDWGFAEPEIERPPPPLHLFPQVTTVSYARSDMTIAVAHVAAFGGENYVETDLRRKDDESAGWIRLGSNPGRTGYHLRRAIGLQADAIIARLSPT